MPYTIINIANKEEWDKFRMVGGYGASEVAALLGYDSYRSHVELFHQKVGFKPRKLFSPKVDYGNATEELSSQLWRSWEHDWQTCLHNYQTGRKVRDCEKLPAFAIMYNDKYPHLFVSPDRLFKVPEVGALEIKDTSGMARKVWINGLNVANEIQNRTQQMVGEFKYGEIFHIVDRANECFMYPIKRSKYIIDDITESELMNRIKFWWPRVIQAREASEIKRQALVEHDNKTAEEAEQIIMALEPGPDLSNAYEKYMNENYLNLARPHIEITGTEDHEKLASEFLKQNEKLKKDHKIMQGIRNRIIAECKTGMRINLPGKGHYMQVKAGKTQTLITVK